MNYICKSFAELSPNEIYAILRLRSEVFVVEQQCIYQDIDDKDTKEGVQHLMLVDEQNILAYARLLPQGLSYKTPSIGRILVAASARKQGLGRQIIRESIKRSLMLWPNIGITIGGQSHLSELYQSFGFQEVSEHYLEDGISHVDMHLPDRKK